MNDSDWELLGELEYVVQASTVSINPNTWSKSVFSGGRLDHLHINPPWWLNLLSQNFSNLCDLFLSEKLSDLIVEACIKLKQSIFNIFRPYSSNSIKDKHMQRDGDLK